MLCCHSISTHVTVTPPQHRLGEEKERRRREREPAIAAAAFLSILKFAMRLSTVFATFRALCCGQTGFHQALHNDFCLTLSPSAHPIEQISPMRDGGRMFAIKMKYAFSVRFSTLRIRSFSHPSLSGRGYTTTHDPSPGCRCCL